MKIKITIFGGLLISLAGLLIVRLIHVQVIEGSWYLQSANENRTFIERIPAPRGVFLDRYAEPLAYNVPAYYLKVNPSQLFSETTQISRIDALHMMASSSASVSFSLDRAVRSPESLSSTIGYVGPVSTDELATRKDLGIHAITGKTGLEKTYDESLQGIDGSIVYEIDALGNRKHAVEEKPPRLGNNVNTTLDPHLSIVMNELMSGKTGAAAIIDTKTGDILSLISAPSYDSTVMNVRYSDQALESERRKKVSNFFTHPKQLFFNRAVSGTYPPGSVFKLVTALAGLETGALNADTIVRDEGTLKIGDDYSYANWYFTQFGRVEGDISLQRAIARSNDIYFYKAAELIGPERLSELAEVFGFGKKTGIELPLEAIGVVPNPEWKEKTLGERWFTGNTYHFGIGQDNLLVTPVQVAQSVQAVGNQGKICKPHLIIGSQARSDQDCAELGIKPENLEIVLKGMLDACSTGGTAFPFFEHNAKHRQPELSAGEEIKLGSVACKTGTAEFGAQDAKGHRRTHAWFAALIGAKALLNGVDPNALALSNSSNASEASMSAKLTPTFYAEWLAKAKTDLFPDSIAVVVLVESDEAEPYREGSRDSAPIVARLVKWMTTGSI